MSLTTVAGSTGCCIISIVSAHAGVALQAAGFVWAHLAVRHACWAEATRMGIGDIVWDSATVALVCCGTCAKVAAALCTGDLGASSPIRIELVTKITVEAGGGGVAETAPSNGWAVVSSAGCSWTCDVKSSITEWAGCVGVAIDVAVGNGGICGGCEHK